MKDFILNVFKANELLGGAKAALKAKTDEFAALQTQLNEALEKINNFDTAKKAYEDQFNKEKAELIAGHEAAIADMAKQMGALETAGEAKAATIVANLGVAEGDIKTSKAEAPANILQALANIKNVNEANKFYQANRDAILAAAGMSK